MRGGNGGGGGGLIACAQQASPAAACRFVACGGSSPSLFAGPPLSLARPRAALAHSARTPRSPLVHCPRRRRRCTALCSLRRFSHLRAAGQPRASRSGVPPERAATRPSGGRERKIRCQHFEIDLEVFFLQGGPQEGRTSLYPMSELGPPKNLALREPWWPPEYISVLLLFTV